MTHPLLGAFLEVDCKSRELMRFAGNNRQREQLRDAVAELRAAVLEVIAVDAAAGAVRVDADTFKAIVRHFREIGLDWPAMVEAFNDVREGG